MPHKDPAARKAYATRWREDNREHVRAAARDYYSAHPSKYTGPHRKAAIYKRTWKLKHPERVLWNNARDRAKEKGIKFTISRNDVAVPQTCPVFGIPLFFTNGARTDNTPSIDRIDNSKGYEPGNILVVSWKANRLKNDARVADLARLVEFYHGVAP